MITTFIHSVQSEWLKKKRSAAFWLTFIGGLFIPLIIFIARIAEPEKLAAEQAEPEFWKIHFGNSWQPMAMFLLPFGIILVTSLVTQMEFKNNSWKQLHALPQSLTTVFFAKLTVILLMMLQVFVLFNIGIYLSGVLPSLFFKDVLYPAADFPFMGFLKGNTKFFIDCLPIVALQYILSLQFKNFLVPIGGGLAIYIASMISMNWKYAYLLPYTYCPLNFIGRILRGTQPMSIHLLALCYFVVFTVIGYLLFINKKEKG